MPLTRSELVVILGGETGLTPRLCEDLRFAASLGLRIMAVGTAVRLLAEAGLLQGRRFSAPGPIGGLRPSPELFSIDGRLATCPDGPPALDVLMHLLSEMLGPQSLAPIMKRCMLPPPRLPVEMPVRLVGPPVLQSTLRLIAEGMARPDILAEAEAATGFSRRHLERLFAQHLQTSPARYLASLRLAEGRRLLMQTTLSVEKIARGLGFSSSSHFCRLYRRQYGLSPHKADAGQQGQNAIINRLASRIAA